MESGKKSLGGVDCPVCHAYHLPHKERIQNGVYATTCENCGHFFKFRVSAGLKSSIKLTVNGKQYTVGSLDPAGPIFNILPNGLRLDCSDAKFVDNYMTDMMDYTKFAYGIHYKLGHANVIVNGGKVQPFCPEDIKGMETCNHIFSANVYLASIQNKCDLKAKMCDLKAETCNTENFSNSSTYGISVGYGMDTACKVKRDLCLDTTILETFCIPNITIWG